jgi:hypothetical protein
VPNGKKSQENCQEESQEKEEVTGFLLVAFEGGSAGVSGPPFFFPAGGLSLVRPGNLLYRYSICRRSGGK